MSTKKIYIVRHGETDYNKNGIVQGGTIDSSLNELGREQAEKFWSTYSEVPFEKVYTSTLKRTHESVKNFIEKIDAWEQFSGLNEISWGDYDGTKIREDDYYWEVVNEWKSGNVNVRIKGGESPGDVRDRQKPVITQIQDSKEGLILVCMHGRAMRILLSHFVDGDLGKMDTYKHHNLGLYVLEMDESGELKIVDRNNTNHLSG